MASESVPQLSGLKSLVREEEEANKVTYRLFIDSLISSNERKEENAFQNELSDYQNLLEKLRELILELTKDYIWQFDDFNLYIQLLPKSKICCLEGSTSFAENIEDEYFVTYIVRKITRDFPCIIATVLDNDGQFLLIEGANKLPEWINPDNSLNRVFVRGGLLHLISLEQAPQENLTLREALVILKQSPGKCIGSEELQNEIWSQKFDNQPERALVQNKHNAKVYLPRKVAYLLKNVPQVLPTITRAYLYNDFLKISGNCAIKRWRSDFLEPEWETVVLRFTRCNFAQLMSQDVKITKTLSKWIENMPNTKLKDYLEYSDEDNFLNLDSCEKSYLLGLKVVLGIEVLLSTYNKVQTGSNIPKLSLNDIFKKYEIDESCIKLYYHHRREHNSMINSALHCHCPHTLVSEAFIKESVDPVVESNLEEDDDSWLLLRPEGLDARLSSLNDESTDLNAYCFNEIYHDMENFVEGESPWNGVVNSPATKPITFDENKFFDIMNTVVETAPDPNSDDLDNGHMKESHEIGLIQLIEAMDQELEEHVSIGSATERVEKGSKSDLDLNFTVVRNLIQSFEAEQGGPGPTSNILNELKSSQKE